MKTAKEIAEGFAWKERPRAHNLRKLAFQEGMRAAAHILETHLAMYPELDDSQQMQLVSVWIKETKEIKAKDEDE